MLEGSTINLECSHGYTYIGPSLSTCTGNEKWEPNPREVECEGNISVTEFLIADPY